MRMTPLGAKSNIIVIVYCIITMLVSFFISTDCDFSYQRGEGTRRISSAVVKGGEVRRVVVRWSEVRWGRRAQKGRYGYRPTRITVMFIFIVPKIYMCFLTYVRGRILLEYNFVREVKAEIKRRAPRERIEMENILFYTRDIPQAFVRTTPIFVATTCVYDVCRKFMFFL